MEKVFEKHLMQAANVVEQQLDNEINRLENLDEDDLEKIRERRMKLLRKAQSQKHEWMQKGHGTLSELPSEKDFFDTCKESKKVVCHFYKNSTFRCKILDSHLKKLAEQHLETKFVKLDVEKAPFLTSRFNIRVIPTMGIVKDGKTQGFIVGFTEFGNSDDFSTEMLEWRLGVAEVINYSGDLSQPPVDGRKHGRKGGILEAAKNKKTIRGRGDDSDTDSD